MSDARVCPSRWIVPLGTLAWWACWRTRHAAPFSGTRRKVARRHKHYRARSKTWTYTVSTVGLTLLTVVGEQRWRKKHISLRTGELRLICATDTRSAEHNCGHSRKHAISGGGKQATNNAVPSKFPKEWSHLIPPSLYFAAMASSGNIVPPSLHGRCSAHRQRYGLYETSTHSHGRFRHRHRY